MISQREAISRSIKTHRPLARSSLPKLETLSRFRCWAACITVTHGWLREHDFIYGIHRPRTPEHVGMPLLAVPYAPDTPAWLALLNRRILADQMRVLQAG